MCTESSYKIAIYGAWSFKLGANGGRSSRRGERGEAGGCAMSSYNSESTGHALPLCLGCSLG